MQDCVQKGFKKLPSNLGFLLTEIPSWLKKSAVRRMQFKSSFQLMNDEDESAENVSFPKLSETRWLVRSKLMLNILLNWEELKAYFACASQNGSQDVRYKARIISDMLYDDIILIFLVCHSCSQ